MSEGNSEQIEQEIKPETPTEASKSFLKKTKEAADRLLNLYGTKTGTAFMTAVNIAGGSLIIHELSKGDIERTTTALGNIALLNILTLSKPHEVSQPRDEMGRFVKKTPQNK